MMLEIKWICCLKFDKITKFRKSVVQQGSKTFYFRLFAENTNYYPVLYSENMGKDLAGVFLIMF